MVATISVPGRVRIDASLDKGFTERPMRVVHLGQSALVLDSAPGREWLTITDAAAGVTPGGMSIPGAEQFARVRSELAAAGLGSTVDLSAWAASAMEPVDLTLRPIDLDGATVLAVSSAVSAPAPARSFDGGLARVRARAADLASACLALEPDSVVADIIGAGPGTTPTGDDMLVGCLAGLAALGRTDAVSALAQAIAPRLTETTTTSRHYLVAAASGRFAEHVHKFVTGFASGSPAERMLEHARRWGATSGVDLLIGLTATLRADLAARTEEGAA